MTTRAPLLLAVLALATLLGACGGGSGADAPSDAAIARGSLLRLGDLPSGWTAQKAGETTGRCDTIEAAKRKVSARVTSPTFSRNETTVASGTVYLFADAAAASTAFRSLTSQQTRECIADVLRSGLAKTSTARFGKPRTGDLAVGSVGDDRAAARLTLPATDEGVHVRLFVDVVYVRVGRGVEIELFSAAPRPFDAALRSRLAAVTARRLAANLAATAA